MWVQEHTNQVKEQYEFPSWSWAAWEGPKDFTKMVHNEDVQVRIYLNDNSSIDLCDKSIKDLPEYLELKAKHRLTLQTYIFKPDSLIQVDRTRYHEYAYTINEYHCALQHYLGKEADENVLDNIRNGVLKLVYTGSTTHPASGYLFEARFIIGRTKGDDSLKRVGLLKMKFHKGQDEIN
jgi:hypothetical protein